jgi:hypothetical protein
LLPSSTTIWLHRHPLKIFVLFHSCASTPTPFSLDVCLICFANTSSWLGLALVFFSAQHCRGPPFSKHRLSSSVISSSALLRSITFEIISIHEDSTISLQSTWWHRRVAPPATTFFTRALMWQRHLPVLSCSAAGYPLPLFPAQFRHVASAETRFQSRNPIFQHAPSIHVDLQMRFNWTSLKFFQTWSAHQMHSRQMV